MSNLKLLRTIGVIGDVSGLQPVLVLTRLGEGLLVTAGVCGMTCVAMVCLWLTLS